MLLDQNIEQNMQTNGCFYHVRFVITLIPMTYFWLVFCCWNDGVAWRSSREACKGRVLVKRCRASGPTVETHRDFGLGATGPRLSAPPGPFKALAHTGPTVEKRLPIQIQTRPTESRQTEVMSYNRNAVTRWDESGWGIFCILNYISALFH